jgi:hypothetical protein
MLTYLYTYLFTYLFTYLLTYLLTYLHTYLFTYLLTYLHTYLLTCLLTYLLTYSLTHSMQQTPFWESNLFTALQKFLRILWNPKYYRVYSCSPPAPCAEPDRSSPCHPHPISSKSILILSSFLSLGLSSGLLPLRFPQQNPACTFPLPRTCYMPIVSGMLAQKNVLIGTVYIS